MLRESLNPFMPSEWAAATGDAMAHCADGPADMGTNQIRLCIRGEPASKANSRKFVTVANRPRMIKSDKARTYERDALRQIPASARVRMAGPVRVTMRIFYSTERPDLDESLILDVLQDRFSGMGQYRQLVFGGVYRNDRQVREKHIYHAIDKKDPRTEIVVEAIQGPQEDLL